MEQSEAEILLIEDSLNDAELTIRALRKNNISNRLIHLRDGAQAIDFLFGTGKYHERDINIKPKVILLDLKMPKVNGIQVLQRIKTDERTSMIPVVILTSSKESLDVRQAYQLGVNSYVVKPVDFESFHKAVSDLGSYWSVLNTVPK